MNVFSSQQNPAALLGTENAHVHIELLLPKVYFYVLADSITISKESHTTVEAEYLRVLYSKNESHKDQLLAL